MVRLRSPAPYGSVPERPKGADCKSVVTDFGGPNPPSPTNTKSLPQSGGLFVLVGDGGLRSPMQGSRSIKPISSALHSTLDPSAARMWSRIHHPRKEHLPQSVGLLCWWGMVVGPPNAKVADSHKPRLRPIRPLSFEVRISQSNFALRRSGHESTKNPIASRWDFLSKPQAWHRRSQAR